MTVLVQSLAQPNGVHATVTKNASSLPPLEDLIVKYGDSSNTTWVEDKFQVWRHPPTGAAQGFATPNINKHASDAELGLTQQSSEEDSNVSGNIEKEEKNNRKRKNFLIAWGNPLCHPSDLPEVVDAFLKWCDMEGYSPIWSCVSLPVEKILAETYGWRAVCCIQEDVLDPRTSQPEKNKEVRKHIRHAEKLGCRIIEEHGVPAPEVQDEINALIKEWKSGRKGTQVHTTNVEPWRDTEHRKYYYARDKDNKVVGFLFLAKVAEGWAIKDSLQSRDAPKNITEWLIASAIHTLAKEGETRLTFGPTPAPSLGTPPNAKMSSTTVRFLSKTYSGIEHALLGNKREFRKKFEVNGEPIFVCFPPHGLGRRGISSLMKVLTD
ncbi:DPS1_1 [Sanghuangporus weigelae]